MPALLHFLIASGTFERGGSISDMSPAKHIPVRGKFTCNRQRTALYIKFFSERNVKSGLPANNHTQGYIRHHVNFSPLQCKKHSTVRNLWGFVYVGTVYNTIWVVIWNKHAQHLFSIKWKPFWVFDGWETTLTKPMARKKKNRKRKWDKFQRKHGSLR